MHGSLCLLIPKPSLALLPLLSLLLITTFFSLSVGMHLYWCIHLCVVFLRFHIQVITYSVCAFLSDISLSIIPSKSVHVANDRIMLFLLLFSLSLVWLFATPQTASCETFLYFTISWILHKLMSIELVMRSNQLILCCPLLLLPSIFHSIKVFSNESALRWFRCPKYWSFSFSISPSRLISFRIDWFDLLVSKEIKSLLQHYSSKA